MIMVNKRKAKSAGESGPSRPKAKAKAQDAMVPVKLEPGATVTGGSDDTMPWVGMFRDWLSFACTSIFEIKGIS